MQVLSVARDKKGLYEAADTHGEKKRWLVSGRWRAGSASTHDVSQILPMRLLLQVGNPCVTILFGWAATKRQIIV